MPRGRTATAQSLADKVVDDEVTVEVEPTEPDENPEDVEVVTDDKDQADATPKKTKKATDAKLVFETSTDRAGAITNHFKGK